MKELKITSQFKKDLKKYQNQPISSSCYDLELTQSCSGNILKVIGVIAGELPTLPSLNFPPFRNTVYACHVPSRFFALDECAGSRHAAEPVFCRFF